MSKEVEFYFDVGSPAAYIAWTQMTKLAQETNAEIQYRPFLLGGVFQAT
ncbi:MAG: 2-hydroxychromene-2-carboxylate isomerase-like protein, partial [Ramlibacter sp.]|nr:2-hydroxychromene-2-carboxylate isomerase-like protein [Ramlibacter sp.]